MTEHDIDKRRISDDLRRAGFGEDEMQRILDARTSSFDGAPADYEKRSREELIARALELGIEVTPSTSKEELVAVLRDPPPTEGPGDRD